MKKIERERLWVFSPVTNISFQAQFAGVSDEETFVNALRQVLDSYEILKTKVVAEDAKTTYSNDFFFEPTQEVRCKIIKDERSLQEIIHEQEKILMDIWNGEFLRLFYSASEDGFRLILLTHHVLGDGLSFAYFFEKILHVLAGEQIEATPTDDFDFHALLKGTKLGFPIRIMMNVMNRKWRKTGRFYLEEDCRELSDTYWAKHPTHLEVACIEGNDYKRLIKYAKSTNQTINTVIIAALLASDTACASTGMAVSVRPTQDKGMGLDATGISIDYKYDTSESMERNMETIRKKINQKRNNPNYKFFLINFLLGMEQSLLDAIYFAATGLSQNKVAIQFCNLFGYAGNTKQALSVTNLGVLPIETTRGDVQLHDVIFAPPLVLNAKRLIGVATVNEKIWFTMQVEDNAEKERHHEVFEQSLKILKQLK